jgi:hypothetical protein
MGFGKSIGKLAVTTLIVAAGALGGCGKKDDEKNEGAYAKVPTAQQCLQQQNQTNNAWNTSYQPYQHNSNVSCGNGYVPACNPNGGGMTCVYANDIRNMGYNPVFYSWNPQYNNYAYSGYYGYGTSNWSFYVTYSNGYYYPNQFAQICDVNYNTCGYGYCRPLRYGHSSGICVR